MNSSQTARTHFNRQEFTMFDRHYVQSMSEDYKDEEYIHTMNWRALLKSFSLFLILPRLRNHNETDDGNVDFRSF